MKKNILITGGSGLIGRNLTNLLLKNNYNVGILTRKDKPDNKIKYFTWNYENKQLDEKALVFADSIIHLAGENISNKRWTNKQKQKIIDSRVKTTTLIYEILNKKNHKLENFISASAIGYYGTFTSDKIFTEQNQAGDDFLSEVVVKWENAADKLKDFSNNLLKFRIGVVLSHKGGALVEMYNVVKKGIGSALGSGNQYMPWISLNDLSRLFLYGLENNLNGVYNAVNPEHITNKVFMQKMTKYFNKPFFMPAIPSFMLKALFGQKASLLLEGSRVSSDKIINKGFVFKDTLNKVFDKIKK